MRVTDLRQLQVGLTNISLKPKRFLPVFNRCLPMAPKGHMGMDNAHAGLIGSNPDTTKDLFNSEKIISAPILSGTSDISTLCLPMA